MNQLDLFPKTIDINVFNSFPLDQMEALPFLPLYQEEANLHVAVPLDAEAGLTSRIQALAPQRALVMHPTSSEKIRELLREITKERKSAPAGGSEPQSPPQDSGGETRAMEGASRGADSAAAPKPSPDADACWLQLLEHLRALPCGDTLWLYESNRQCRVIRRHGVASRTLMTIPLPVYHQVHERLEDETAMAGMWDDARWVLIDSADGSLAAFKMWQMDCLEQHISWLQRMPAFSAEALRKAHPQAPSIIEDLRHLFGEHRRMIIGGKDVSLIKQCFYSLIEPVLEPGAFPPAFFVERDAAMYLPGVAQLTQYEYALMRLMENFDGENAPFVFFETELTEIMPDDELLGRFWTGRWENLAVYMPFENIRDMREELQANQEWRKGGFLPVFFHNRFLKTL